MNRDEADTLLRFLTPLLFSNDKADWIVFYLNGVCDGLSISKHEDLQWYIDLFYAACEIRDRNECG